MLESESIKLPSFLNLAKKMANESSAPFKLGSVFVKSGRVFSKGFNKYDGINYLARRFFAYPTIHAEIDSLKRVSLGCIRGGILYVFRATKDGMPAMAKPCIRCQRALRILGVKKIIYSTKEYPFYKEERI